MFDKDILVKAHKHSSKHKEEILHSEICGCFYCFNIFSPETILDWVDDGNIEAYPELESSSALCPKCGIDAVIGSMSGYPVSNRAFLKAMYNYWF